MSRRKGELSSSQIDREYPHQVALPADQCSGKNHDLIQIACANLSVAPRHHSVRRHDRDYIVFCFATDLDANGFMALFGGEKFSPKNRGRGRKWFEWRK